MVMLTYLCPSYDVHSPTLYCSDADSLPSLKHERFGHIDDLAPPSVKNNKKMPESCSDNNAFENKHKTKLLFHAACIDLKCSWTMTGLGSTSLIRLYHHPPV